MTIAFQFLMFNVYFLNIGMHVAQHLHILGATLSFSYLIVNTITILIIILLQETVWSFLLPESIFYPCVDSLFCCNTSREKV